MLGWLFWGTPELLPRDIGIFGVDELLEIPVLVWVLVRVFCVGFVHVFNKADGANVLVLGIAAATLTVFFF